MEEDGAEIIFQHLLAYTSTRTGNSILETAPLSETQMIDDHIQSVACSLDELSLKFSRYAAALKTKRNSKVPISKVPPEILSVILQESLKHCHQGPRNLEGRPANLHTYYPSLHVLRRVCKSWRIFIDSTAAFWFIIDFRSKAQHRDAAIRNSGSHGLWIYCDEPGYELGRVHNSQMVAFEGESRRVQTLTAFSSKISEHSWRWKSACIDGFAPDSLEEALCKPAPLLQSLHLSELPWLEKGPRNLFGADAPSLQDVSIRDVDVDWSSPIFRGLQHLELFELSCRSVSTIRTILFHSPDIRSLVLGNVQFADGSPCSFAPIDLPHLGTLHLYEIRSSAMHELLKCIKSVSPRCKLNIELFATLEGAPDHNDGRYLVTALQHLEADLGRMWSFHSQRKGYGAQLPNALLTYYSGQLHIDFGGALKVTLGDETFSSAMVIDVLKTLSPLIERWQPSVHFNIELELGGGAASIIEAASQGLHVVRIRIGYGEILEHNGPEYSDLIDILARISSPDTEGRWYCPDMTELVLHVDTQGDPVLDGALLRLAKSQRKITPNTPQEGNPSSLGGTPKPFKLVIRGISVSLEACIHLYQLLGEDGSKVDSLLRGWEDGTQVVRFDWNADEIDSNPEASNGGHSDSEL